MGMDQDDTSFPVTSFPGCFQQEEVQRFPTGNLGNRHHVVPAKVSAFSFHATLFMPFAGVQNSDANPQSWTLGRAVG